MSSALALQASLSCGLAVITSAVCTLTLAEGQPAVSMASMPVDTVQPWAVPSDLAARTDALQEHLEQLRRRIDRTPADAPKADPVDLEAEVDRILVARGLVEAAEEPGQAKSLSLPEDPGACVDAILAAGINGEAAGPFWELADQQDRLHEILAAWQERADATPNSPQARFELAQAYYKAAQQRPVHQNGNWWVDSDNAYGEVLELSPDHWEARYERAVHLSFWPAAYGGQARAVRHFEVLIDQQESRGVVEAKQAHVYRWLGNLLDQQGRSVEARKVWERGVERHPQDNQLRKKLGG